MGRFLADLGSILEGSGDHLGMIWACSGGVPGWSRACFSLEKATYINFQKIDFGDRWGACSFLRRIRPSGSGAKINFDKNYDSVPAGPDRGVSRVRRRRPAITSFRFTDLFKRARPGRATTSETTIPGISSEPPETL